MLLSCEGQARLGQKRFDRRQVRFRRLQRVMLDLRVEPRDELAGLEHVAHMQRALDHSAVEPKGEADLVFRADLARQRDDLAFAARLDRDGPDGPRLGGGNLRLVAARQRERDYGSHHDSRCKHDLRS